MGPSNKRYKRSLRPILMGELLLDTLIHSNDEDLRSSYIV